MVDFQYLHNDFLGGKLPRRNVHFSTGRGMVAIMKKRLLSVLLCLCMVVGMLPAVTLTAMADGIVMPTSYNVNLSSSYYTSSNPFYQRWRGQCTWYCFGRAMEKCGISLPCRGDAGGWLNEVSNSGRSDISVGDTPRANSILVTAVHVAFIEKLEGNMAYTTEANVIIQGTHYDYYENSFDISGGKQFGGTILGYIYLGSSQATAKNLGDDFYAYIRNTHCDLSLENHSNNVQLATNNDYDPRQIWHFVHLGYQQYKVINMYDGRCLDTDGSNVRVMPYTGMNNQYWQICGSDSYSTTTLYYLAPPSYGTNNSNHTSVLDVAYGNDDYVPAGRNVQLSKNWYGGSDSNFINNGPFHKAQTFQIIKISDSDIGNRLADNSLGTDFYATINYAGQRLEATGIVTDNGSNMDVQASNARQSDPKQVWHFTRQSNGSYKITNEYSSWCLDVSSTAANNVRVRMWYLDNGTPAQQWYLMRSPGESSHRLSSALLYPWSGGNAMFSLHMPSTATGTNPVIYQQDYVDNQRFTIEKLSYTRPAKPTAPTNIQVSATSSGTTITWDAVPAVSAYDSRAYRVYLSSISENQVLIPYTIVSGTSYTSDIVLPDGDYEVILQSINTKYPNLRSTINWLDFSIAPEPVTHTITVETTEGGTASGDGTYSDGASVTVLAVASEGYEFKGWAENGSIVSTEANYTFNATADHTLTATFEKMQAPAPVTHTVSVGADPAAGGTVTGSGTYQDGESVTVTATANEGYTFKHWTENGSEVSASASYTFNAAADRTLVAVFEKGPDEPDPPTPVTTYTVNINASPAAGGTVSGGGTYQSGASATVRAVANSGYTFKGWTKGGTQVSTDASYTFSVTEDTSLTAVFEADTPTPTPTYRISVSAMTGGTVSGGGTYQSGASVTVTATPSNDYQFVEWRESGNQVSTSASYTFSATTNRTLMAVFERTETPPTPSYTVNVSADPAAGGSVSGGGSFQRGASATVSATPNDGYRFVCWKENGEAVSFNSSYTFSVSGNTTLTSVFEANTPTPSTSCRVSVQASPAEGGTVTGSNTYHRGATVTIAATPNSGYQFKEWQLDGRQISATASYTFTASADQAFTAIFEKVEQPPVKTYSVSLSANPSAGGSVSGGGTFAENSTATITATTNSNYRFTGWFENGSQVSASASYTFTVSADRTLVAGFTYTGGSTVTPGGNPGGNPSSGTTGNTSPSQPSLPVSTSGANSSMTTTASPNATIRGDTATSVITSAIAQEIIKQATANNSGVVVIAPVVRADVTKAEITLPATVLSEIEQKTTAGLVISTPNADVSFQNNGLSTLSNRQDVVVATERTGNALELSITVVGQPVERVPGGMVLTTPVDHSTPGTVAVVLHEDGSREVIRKSMADGNSITIPLDSPAKLEIIDNAKSFADVSADSWAADAVAFASGHELFSGTSSDRFSPDLPMTRGMLAMVLHNLENNPAQPLAGMFSDVVSDAWYSEAVAWAAARGIVSGYGNGLFGPGDNITREQLAVMLWRYAGSPAATNKELHFSDAGEASNYALDALLWSVEDGIINGKGGGILDPKGLATRAQVAQMLKNYLER